MNQLIRNNKALVILIGILLVSNVLLVLYFTVWSNRSGKPPMNRGGFSMVEQMTKELGFSKSQADTFKILLDQNRDSMKYWSEQVRSIKKSMYSNLNNTSIGDSALAVKADSLAATQAKMELSMYRHFAKVRAICTPDQLPKFDTVVSRMINRPPWFGKNRGPQKRD